MPTPVLPNYVLITPARNEAAYIEATIQAVVAQTIRPLRWVIVSDGSTDGTDEIVRRHAREHPWIELARTTERSERHFAGKVQAFNAGYAKLQSLHYEVIASLDADITFEAHYFEYLLTKLANDARLGLVGTPFQELGGERYDYRFVNIEHVSGACQVFRRACFEDIGGYVPVKGGCIDHIAVLSARFAGWKTRTFTETVCYHHRQMGTAQHSRLRARFNGGIKDHMVGNHPFFEILRCCYQMTKPPLIAGGLLILAGYGWAILRRVERPIPRELVAFVRREQQRRLRNMFLGKLIQIQRALKGPV